VAKITESTGSEKIAIIGKFRRRKTMGTREKGTAEREDIHDLGMPYQ
jgi:hypothetical protein